ncbi:M20 metallopeptidase family protein [Paracraurococcus ruber]|uniref:N-acyl-L-amino acid amidohydrolase n=1 Tax=Paracraurococcus ruber TaxID=77675 RepID=A0ABS1CW22_9PROT|nr:M20 family metallopeptidase [Paracraurococcus ruber]MBK1658718.1 N-acyl-L-amino acid amidohydrolase [Paracraurococcus ruber]TDG30062.1 amidohydrolase [Paracraurococcus ruber]
MPDAADRLNDPQTRIREAVAAIEPGLVAIRRDIHAHPELGFEEVRTAGIVAAELARLGIPHRTGVGRTGVVGVIEGARPGPTLAIRADMDALPIQEATGLPFASTVAGKMHACGHDIHTTTLLGVADVLQGLAPQLAGKVVLVFQPAEEALGGAAAMVAEGVLDGVDMALGFHNAPNLPVGQFGFCRGETLAAADRFELVVGGRSGHAAHPHKAVDPIVAAAAFVSQAQTVVSREIDPLMPAVVTIGMIHGGTAPNIIPETVELKGTVRTLHPAARDAAEAALRRLAAGLDAMHRTRSEFVYRRGVPPLRNDDRVLDPAIAAVRRQLGEVVTEGRPSMGAEDFAEFAERVPAFQLRIGSGAPGRNDALHNDRYQPDEGCIGLGVQALSRIALDMLA